MVVVLPVPLTPTMSSTAGLSVVRQGAHGAVEVGAQGVGEDVAEQRAGLVGGADGAAGELGAEGLDELHGHLGAEVGLEERGLDVLPGLLVQLPRAEQAEQALPEAGAGAGQPPAQALQPALGRGDVGGAGGAGAGGGGAVA